MTCSPARGARVDNVTFVVLASASDTTLILTQPDGKPLMRMSSTMRQSNDVWMAGAAVSI